jgi:RNA polymerase sigma-70 factor (ECF subfamily)
MTPLVAQRSRSDRAFERMYKRHVGDVYRYALAVMRNPADAEDVTQTTFLNAYRSFVEKGKRPEKPQNWLIAIAHNVCRQRFRQTARRPSEIAFEDDLADTIVDDDTPTGEDLRRALSHLAFNQRAALVMRELEGRSYAEIAEILDVSTSAVETLIFRARRALREQLEGSLTCGEAEFAISRQLDRRLPRAERGQLRAHLRECPECAAFARRQRAQRGALKSLAFVPLPGSLGSFFGGGSTAVGTGVALKAATALTAGLVIGGAGYEGVKRAPWPAPASHAPTPAAPVVGSVTPVARVPAPREHMPVASAAKRVAHKDLAMRRKTVKKPHAPAGQANVQTHGRALGHQKQRVIPRPGYVKVHAHPLHPTQSHKPAPKPKAEEPAKDPGPPADNGSPSGKQK